MSSICNRFLPVPDERRMAAKGAAVKSAVRYVHLATSEIHLLAAHLDEQQSTRHSLAHLQACARHLKAAVTNYNMALEIVKDSIPTAESMHWVRNLDYQRFFDTHVAKGRIPNRPDLWKRIVDCTRDGKGVKSVVEIRDTLQAIQTVMNGVFNEGSFDQNPVHLVRVWIAQLSELNSFSLMVGELNDVKLLDPLWVLETFNTSTVANTKEARA